LRRAIRVVRIETNPIIYYGAIGTLVNSSGYLFPQRVTGTDPNVTTPYVMNFHFSVQQSIGFGVVLYVSYVGSLGRDLLWNKLLDSIPLGTDFIPGNANPVNPKTALRSTFLRNLTGYDGVTYEEWASSSNYHALQVTAQRRFARGFQMGAFWTWSKAMDFNDNDSGVVASVVPVRLWNYGLAGFDRTHVFKANWVYDIPKTPWHGAIADRILNNWQISGVISCLGCCGRSRFTTTSCPKVSGQQEQAPENFAAQMGQRRHKRPKNLQSQMQSQAISGVAMPRKLLKMMVSRAGLELIRLIDNA